MPLFPSWLAFPGVQSHRGEEEEISGTLAGILGRYVGQKNTESVNGWGKTLASTTLEGYCLWKSMWEVRRLLLLKGFLRLPSCPQIEQVAESLFFHCNSRLSPVACPERSHLSALLIRKNPTMIYTVKVCRNNTLLIPLILAPPLTYDIHTHTV